MLLDDHPTVSYTRRAVRTWGRAEAVQHPRIALIYDDSLRPDTTGGYCLRALRSLASATHVPPHRIGDTRGQFDLWLRVDDGLDFRLLLR